MAKTVKLAKGKEFSFEKMSAASKYPWEEWLKGELLMLERSSGEEDEKGTITTVTAKRDYEVSTDAMPPKIKTAARRRYKHVDISRRDADGAKMENAIIIRARDMTPDERQAEDELRAEEREAKKARASAEASENGEAEAHSDAPEAAPVS
jgi:hypothetical protein